MLKRRCRHAPPRAVVRRAILRGAAEDVERLFKLPPLQKMIPLAQRGGPGGDQFVRPFADEGVLFAQRVGDARRRGGGVEIRLRLDAFFQQQTAAARRTYGGAAVRVGCEIFPAPGGR